MATNIWVNLPVESGTGSGITSVNGETGPAITIAAGTGISIATVSNTITITNTVTDTGITQLTGDVTAGPGSGSQVATLATVNANVGSFGSSTSIPNFTVNGKGLITAAGSNVVIAPAGTLTGTTLAANVVTSSLTSVGTIVTGVWNGTVIDVAHGGTSLATLTANNVILGNGTSSPLFVAPGSSGNVLTSNGTTWSSSAPASSGVTTVGSIDTNANSNALFISGSTISTQSASATNPGMVNTTTQTLAGAKTFSGATTISNTSTTALTINAGAFEFDATNFTMGINNSAPDSATFIDGINTSSATKRLLLTGYGSASLVGFRSRLARNTVGTPQAVQSGDILGFYNAEGYGTSQFPASATGGITFYAGETFTNTSNLTYAVINSTPTGSISAVENLRVASIGVTVGPQSSSTAVHLISGGIKYVSRSISGNLTLDTTTTDYLVFVDTSGGAVSITFPAPVAGRVFVIKDSTGSFGTNNCTMVRNGSEKIEGIAASKVLQTNWGASTFTTNGTDWFMI